MWSASSAVLDERSRVEEQVEALPHRQLAELALARDAVRPTHAERRVLAALHVVDERGPVVEIVGHVAEPTLGPHMKRGVVAVALALAVVVACTDDEPPAGGSSSGSSAAVSSGSDQALARSMARTLADGIQQGAAGRVSSAQADCLVNEIATRIPVNALAAISSTAPEPKTLPKDVRQAFGEAFDNCLTGDIVDQLKETFDL